MPSRAGPSKPIQGFAVHLWGIDVAAALVRWLDRPFSPQWLSWSGPPFGRYRRFVLRGVGCGIATPSKPGGSVQGVAIFLLGL